MMRARRASTTTATYNKAAFDYEYSALPSYCDYYNNDEDASSRSSNSTMTGPPSSIAMSDCSMSSYYEEDDPVIIEEVSCDSCYVKQRSTTGGSWQSLLLRSFFVATILAVVGNNLRYRFQNHTTSNNNDAIITQQYKAKLIEKYGRGPHLMEFQLRIWDENNTPVNQYFTVEMAPIDLMPIATLTFLEQASLGLWNGASIFLNTDHVIGARPVSGDGKISKIQSFRDAGLETLPIIESNDSNNYPHVPYTLAFSGNGPHIYINKQSNEHHDDACFGTIVLGRSTVDKIAQMQGYEHDPTHIRPIDIVAVHRVSIHDMNDSAMKEYISVKSA